MRAQARENAQSLPIFRDVTPHDAVELAQLAREASGFPWTEAFVTWKYFGNPAGPVFGCCAELGDRLVGLYSDIPVRLRLGERIVAAAQAVDAMVAPEVRRMGLFTRVAWQTFPRTEEAGVELIYAFPNPVSLVGSVGRLGFVYAGEIPRYTKVLDPAAVLAESGLRGPVMWGYRSALEAARAVGRGKGALPDRAVRVREVDGFDARFDALWAGASGGFPIAVVRDAAYLTWRYLQNPLVDYRILIAERGDALVGYTVLSLCDLEKDGTVALAELLVAPGDREAGLALLAGVTADAREMGGTQVQCWMVPQRAFYRELLVRSGFVYWPFRLLPRALRYSTSFIVRTSAGTEFSPDPAQLGNWFLTMGDQDYY